MTCQEFNARFAGVCDDIVAAANHEDFGQLQRHIGVVNRELEAENLKFVWKAAGPHAHRFEIVNTLTGDPEDSWITHHRPVY